MAKSPSPTKAERIAKAKRDLEKALKASGYRRMQAKHGKSTRPSMPDLSTNSPQYPSLGNGFGKATGKRQLPEGAKQFPVGNSHKQGPMLVTSFDNLADMGGKKT